MSDEFSTGLDFGPDGFDPDGGDLDGFDSGLLGPDDELPPEVELDQARTRVKMRGVVFFLVTAVSLWCVFGIPTTDDFSYFISGGDTPTDLGDLQEHRRDGDSELPFVQNAYVSVRGQIMTYEAETEKGDESFFFDPLYNIITRTPRELPEKRSYRVVPIPSYLVYLIENRRAFAEDLTVGFDGTGRLLRADHAGRWGHIYKAYKRTIPDIPPPDETWILLDGDSPDTYWPYGVAYGVAVLLVLMTGFFFFRAIRGLRRIQREWS